MVHRVYARVPLCPAPSRFECFPNPYNPTSLVLLLLTTCSLSLSLYMASASTSRGSAELPVDRRERAEASPERGKVRIETKPPRRSSDKKKDVAVAAVVYYLSRNNHLEHPHYMEVTFSDDDEGLFLRGIKH